jgi:hypothetical protein
MPRRIRRRCFRRSWTEAAESGVPAEDAAELLRYIYRAPLENAENRLAYWMLIAVHGHTEGLVDAWGECERGLVIPAHAV